jgi:hypothetical protein
MEPVKEQEVGDQIVPCESLERLLALLTFCDDLHHARQTLAVEVEKNPYHFGGFGSGGRVFESFYLPEKRLHPGDSFL